MTIQRYEFHDQIGEGAFSSVVAARDRQSGDMVAIKRMKKRRWKDTSTHQEIDVLRKLAHPNVIMLRDAFREDYRFYLVFERMELNLFQWTQQRHGQPYDEPVVRSIAQQILEGVAFIHHQGYFHRDLKPENILISGSRVKIADFGLVQKANTNRPLTAYISTRWYRAPEVLLECARYSCPIDLWAVGTIIAEILLTQPLFPGQSQLDQLNRIFQVTGSPNFHQGTSGLWYEGALQARQLGICFVDIPPKGLGHAIPQASPAMLALLQGLLVLQPECRISARQALCHAVFRGVATTLDHTTREGSGDLATRRQKSLSPLVIPLAHQDTTSSATPFCPLPSTEMLSPFELPAFEPPELLDHNGKATISTASPALFAKPVSPVHTVTTNIQVGPKTFPTTHEATSPAPFIVPYMRVSTPMSDSVPIRPPRYRSSSQSALFQPPKASSSRLRLNPSFRGRAGSHPLRHQASAMLLSCPIRTELEADRRAPQPTPLPLQPPKTSDSTHELSHWKREIQTVAWGSDCEALVTTLGQSIGWSSLPNQTDPPMVPPITVPCTSVSVAVNASVSMDPAQVSTTLGPASRSVCPETSLVDNALQRPMETELTNADMGAATPPLTNSSLRKTTVSLQNLKSPTGSGPAARLRSLSLLPPTQEDQPPSLVSLLADATPSPLVGSPLGLDLSESPPSLPSSATSEEPSDTMALDHSVAPKPSLLMEPLAADTSVRTSPSSELASPAFRRSRPRSKTVAVINENTGPCRLEFPQFGLTSLWEDFEDELHRRSLSHDRPPGHAEVSPMAMDGHSHEFLANGNPVPTRNRAFSISTDNGEDISCGSVRQDYNVADPAASLRQPSLSNPADPSKTMPEMTRSSKRYPARRLQLPSPRPPSFLASSQAFRHKMAKRRDHSAPGSRPKVTHVFQALKSALRPPDHTAAPAPQPSDNVTASNPAKAWSPMAASMTTPYRGSLDETRRRSVERTFVNHKPKPQGPAHPTSPLLYSVPGPHLPSARPRSPMGRTRPRHMSSFALADSDSHQDLSNGPKASTIKQRKSVLWFGKYFGKSKSILTPDTSASLLSESPVSPSRPDSPLVPQVIPVKPIGRMDSPKGHGSALLPSPNSPLLMLDAPVAQFERAHFTASVESLHFPSHHRRGPGYELPLPLDNSSNSSLSSTSVYLPPPRNRTKEPRSSPQLSMRCM
ncbi:hypothetical protein H4R34_002096 [Dimargaris verticillata]|uniref:Protein kinase domain-containing protein n=1 Tax=Dimargaris verticillata TaxID=2761393 RepID=A0A9W8ED71_9FUNG|nr:hypothetical protein H4R34_002096 [Dimargaris verticillata]